MTSSSIYTILSCFGLHLLVTYIMHCVHVAFSMLVLPFTSLDKENPSLLTKIYSLPHTIILSIFDEYLKLYLTTCSSNIKHSSATQEGQETFPSLCFFLTHSSLLAVAPSSFFHSFLSILNPALAPPHLFLSGNVLAKKIFLGFPSSENTLFLMCSLKVLSGGGGLSKTVSISSYAYLVPNWQNHLVRIRKRGHVRGGVLFGVGFVV